MNSAQKAERLRNLHKGPEILVLPNAWDCASARIFELAGFPAIPTTSAGVAFALGYPDGQRISQADMLAQVKRIAHSVDVPVTADLEAGYGDVGSTAAALVKSGAVGLNLEDIDAESDQLVELSEQVQRIRTIRQVGNEAGVPLVINARTDYYLAEIGDPAERFEAACHRLKQYIEAGADCVFVPGITDPDLIRSFVEALRFPVNVLVGPGTPPISELQALGVARVSVGSGIMRSTMELTRRIAQELKMSGTYRTMLEISIPYAEANAAFER
ncbi:MAG: isocitrate lyase/phosphoenolpyruvate mutase family protein [Acidobacteriaceae bacterium]|nr:isocitrate lyase/phosphoenolpyruvate mutase family protein [Acidobacteriaceae bacterium]MBV9501987.1 isocitrate lyase/phosphoenolpyruvate mutase family protein [Acidobacteriaceae bacterium]